MTARVRDTIVVRELVAFAAVEEFARVRIRRVVVNHDGATVGSGERHDWASGGRYFDGRGIRRAMG